MRERINLLHVIGSLQIGGAEKLLVSTMRKIDKKRFNPIVCCTGAGGELEQNMRECGIPVKVLCSNRPGSGSFYDLIEIVRLAYFMRKNRIDIVHTHLFESNVIGRIAAKLAKVPVTVSTIHNIYHWKKGKGFKNRIKALVDKITANYFTDMLIAVSDSVRKYHIDLGFNAKKIVILRNMVDLNEFKPLHNFDPVKKRRELRLDINCPVILNVAVLSEQKGHKYLLKAAKSILTTVPNTQFLIVGDGPLKAQLMSIAKIAGVSDNVTFIGMRKDIPELLSTCDIFVMSSLWEGLPITLLEAMAMAKPIVATSVGGIPEVIENGKDGILVPPKDPEALADAIIYLLRNKEKAKEMGIAAMKKVEEQYSASVVVRKLEQLYEELLSKKLKNYKMLCKMS